MCHLLSDAADQAGKSCAWLLMLMCTSSEESRSPLTYYVNGIQRRSHENVRCPDWRLVITFLTMLHHCCSGEIIAVYQEISTAMPMCFTHRQYTSTLCRKLACSLEFPGSCMLKGHSLSLSDNCFRLALPDAYVIQSKLQCADSASVDVRHAEQAGKWADRSASLDDMIYKSYVKPGHAARASNFYQHPT